MVFLASSKRGDGNVSYRDQSILYIPLTTSKENCGLVRPT